LGDATEDRIVSIFCHVAQGSQGKYSQLSLSPTVTLVNAANVNDPLELKNLKFSFISFCAPSSYLIQKYQTRVAKFDFIKRTSLFNN
jgi:hypothetical protein